MTESSTVSALTCHFPLSTTLWASVQPAELYLIHLAWLSPPILVMFSHLQWFPFPIHLFLHTFFFSLFIQLRVLYSLQLTRMSKSMKEIDVMNAGWSCVCGKWLSSNSEFIFSSSDCLFFSHFCVHLCKRKRQLLSVMLIPSWIMWWKLWTIIFYNRAFLQINNFLHNLLEIKFNPKKNMMAAVFTPLIISLCLLSYPNTNYCFLSVRQKGWGCIFKQPDAINNSHTPSTDNMCVSLRQNLPSEISQVRLLCASDTYLQIISIRPKRERDLWIKHCSYDMYCRSFHLWPACNKGTATDT